MRCNFSPRTKEQLAKRVGYRCSNSECCQATSGPRSDSGESINIGVAAHITAATAAGPRFNGNLTDPARRAADNGIWLCQNCAKLVDNDPDKYTVDILYSWKKIAEATARREIEKSSELHSNNSATSQTALAKIERLMPDLLAEMRADLAQNPVRREFVVLKKSWSYWPRGDELVYYYEDHLELDAKLQVLENLAFVNEITYNNTNRYLMTEELADYLIL